ncbi:MAG TPA: glycosyltransferase family 39 protein [Gemmatimonadales bacterium]|nr:glycosyltransferase family 39 protein [Gemmatimonadales bacterium]
MPSIPSRPGFWPLVILALSLLAFAATAGHAIARPGLDYDELLFVNAATGGENPSFIYRRLFGVPVLLMEYIGALKAYLYTPIFALFGVSAATIRWPAIVISMGSITLTYALARLSLPPMAAATAAALLALDPVFVLLTKVDYGPIALMVLLKLTALYCVYRSLATGSAALLWGAVAACALGLFDKLNFIWFVLALLPTTLLLFRPELASMYRRDGARLVASIGTLGLLVLAVGLRHIAPLFLASQESDRGIIARIPPLLAGYAAAMDGRAVYQWLTESPLRHPTVINYATLAALLLLGRAWWQRARTARSSPRLPLADRMVLGYGLLFVLIGAQIVITERAGGPHHMMMLSPFPLLLLTAALAELAGTPSRLRRGAALLLLGALALSDLRVTHAYAQVYQTEERLRPRLSPVIYQLSAFLNSEEADRIIFVDWGMHNQAYALGTLRTRRACRDMWLTFREPILPGRSADLLAREFGSGRVLVIMHPRSADSGVGAQDRFLQWADSHNLVLQPVRTFRDRGGRVLYQASVIQRPGESARSPT